MLYDKISLDDSASLELYIADRTEKYSRKAILIMPGGGYRCICTDREGEPIALAFLKYGFNAFVLSYSVCGKKTFPAQLFEASKAMKYIRDNADEFGIDVENVFAVGFSAGGHLAASLATMWNMEEIYKEIEMPYGYNKPKGVVLAYPVITGVGEFSRTVCFQNLFGTKDLSDAQCKESSIQLNVTKDSSPAYIIHAANDSCVPVENSLLLAFAYSKNKVPYELHIYPRGEHGFALANEITWAGNDEFIQKENEMWVQNVVRWTDTLE